MTSEPTGNLVIVQLTKEEARNAKIAIGKAMRSDEYDDEDSIERVKGEFDASFGEDAPDEYDAPMRFEFRESDAQALGAAIAEHAHYRREKDHLSSAKKYQSIADRLEDQLIQQGVMVQ